jgi:pyridoxamine 5'-phosphate oxidase
MLEACHGRIETQLATLERLSSHLLIHGADEQAREAAHAVVRYFDTAGVQHHRDEDEDLFPLLRHLAAESARAEIAAVINDLEREHATMDLQWSRLREQLDAVVRSRSARLDASEVARFAWLYRSHIDREAAAVLPFAKEALTAQQRAALGKRMAARRSTRA